MLEGVAHAFGFGRTDNDDVLPGAPGTNAALQQRGSDTGADDDTEWNLVMAGATRGAAMAVSQTQETEQPPPGQQRQPPNTGAAAPPPIVQEEFSGIATALQKQVHQNYDITVVTSELSLQQDIH